jgi:hypothetical protein
MKRAKIAGDAGAETRVVILESGEDVSESRLSTWKPENAEFQRIPRAFSSCRLLILERPSIRFRFALA